MTTPSQEIIYVGICACHKDNYEYMETVPLNDIGNDKSDYGKIGTLLSIFAEGSTAKTVAAGTVQTR